MKALVLKEFGRVAVEMLPDATAGRGEVLIEIVATGICGSDIHGFTGDNGRRIPGQVMGHETVGRIVDLGPGTEDSGLEVGQVATFNPVVVSEEDAITYRGREQHSPDKKVIGVATDIISAFSQLIAVPLRNVVPLPSDIPIEYGALVEPLAVALHAVRRAGVRAGQRVLVVGGGPIGQSVVLALRMEGVTEILVSEVEPARRALVECLGVRAIDPAGGPVVELVTASFGGLADVSLDAVGLEATLADALASTRFGGSVALVGMGSKSLRFDAFRVSTEERTIVGSFTYSAQDFSDAAAWVATGPAVVGELISREVALADANEAFLALAGNDGTAGKVLVRLDL